MARALKVVERAGGKVTDTEIVVPAEEPKAPALEQWAVDGPSALVESGNGLWTWGQGWRDTSWRRRNAKTAETPGTTATLAFSGTGVAIMGDYDDKGGTAEVLVDGAPSGTINAREVTRTHESVYLARHGSEAWTAHAGGAHQGRRPRHDSRRGSVREDDRKKLGPSRVTHDARSPHSYEGGFASMSTYHINPTPTVPRQKPSVSSMIPRSRSKSSPSSKSNALK